MAHCHVAGGSQEQSDHEIRKQDGVGLPLRIKAPWMDVVEASHAPVTPEEDGEEEDQGDHDETIPCCIGLGGGFEGEVLSEMLNLPAGSEWMQVYVEGGWCQQNSLILKASGKMDAYGTDPEPCHQTSDRCHVLEPTEE